MFRISLNITVEYLMVSSYLEPTGVVLTEATDFGYLAISNPVSATYVNLRIAYTVCRTVLCICINVIRRLLIIFF